MIDLYLQAAIARWPADFQSLGNALRIALPVILIGAVVLAIARGLQHWIDKMEREKPAQTRTADAQMIQGDIDAIWRSVPDAPPRRAADPPKGTGNPFPQPDDERRTP